MTAPHVYSVRVCVPAEPFHQCQQINLKQYLAENTIKNKKCRKQIKKLRCSKENSPMLRNSTTHEGTFIQIEVFTLFKLIDLHHPKTMNNRKLVKEQYGWYHCWEPSTEAKFMKQVKSYDMLQTC